MFSPVVSTYRMYRNRKTQLPGFVEALGAARAKRQHNLFKNKTEFNDSLRRMSMLLLVTLRHM